MKQAFPFPPPPFEMGWERSLHRPSFFFFFFPPFPLFSPYRNIGRLVPPSLPFFFRPGSHPGDREALPFFFFPFAVLSHFPPLPPPFSTYSWKAHGGARRCPPFFFFFEDLSVPPLSPFPPPRSGRHKRTTFFPFFPPFFPSPLRAGTVSPPPLFSLPRVVSSGPRRKPGPCPPPSFLCGH